MEIRVFSTFYCVRVFFFFLGIGRNANFWSFASTQTLGTAGEPQVTATRGRIWPLHERECFLANAPSFIQEMQRKDPNKPRSE